MKLGVGEPQFTSVMRIAGGWLVSCNYCRAVIGIGEDDQRLHLEWHKEQEAEARRVLSALGQAQGHLQRSLGVCVNAGLHPDRRHEHWVDDA